LFFLAFFGLFTFYPLGQLVLPPLFRWDIPGANYILGTNDTSLHPIFTFSTPGLKTITLTGYTAGNDSFSMTKTNLLTAVSISIYTSKSVASPIDLIQLYRIITPQPSSFKWKFDRKVAFEPGYSELSVVPLFKTLDTGSYSFSLTAYYGANDSVVVSANNILRIYTSQISVTPTMGQIAVTPIKAKAQVSSPATFKWKAFQMATQLERVTILANQGDSCRLVGLDTGWFAIELTCYFNHGDTLVKTFHNAFYIYADSLLQKPKVNFSSNKLNGKVDEEFFFTNLTEGIYTNQKWSIQPFDVWLIDCNENSRDLHLTFLQPGKYSVALVAANAFGKDSVYKKDYINITESVGLPRTSPALNELHLFPNPSKGSFILLGLGEDSYQYQLVDLSGKLLEEGFLQSHAQRAEIRLQQSYQDGSYLLQIMGENHWYFKRILLIH
jgi:PKD repeat protein